jgi:hypothetical protein
VEGNRREVRQWLRVNPQLQADSALLPRRDGEPMTRANVSRRLERAVQAATTKRPELAKLTISPHLVRHSTAMSLLQAGTYPSDIALWLGHESPSTTHLYVEADLAMKERSSCSAETACGQAGSVPTAQGPAAARSPLPAAVRADRAGVLAGDAAAALALALDQFELQPRGAGR